MAGRVPCAQNLKPYKKKFFLYSFYFTSLVFFEENFIFLFFFRFVKAAFSFFFLYNQPATIIVMPTVINFK